MRKAFTLALAALLMTGCGIVYRQPVFQGNLLESKNVEQLKEGMSRQQVFSLLGSPPVADPFHQNRWDYVATERRRVGKTEIKTLTLHFEGDALARWEGEYFPEADKALSAEMRRFGNLARDKDKPRVRPSGG
ncbi:outer membrane protein assembly factor BamE [Arenimonas terrae]|uniref:Outer membrane protein assembly factor BamE n=1 Tax=Arenimonas terrae TaxID=2546226 RepID=A0A5C4RUA3_9GAMM|nr:outer membrane protein assembly factor BamE [Arenimonas terrae]TNJ34545.1 outer membrane protein assembly factor BamE [Arenimonas terrae]